MSSAAYYLYTVSIHTTTLNTTVVRLCNQFPRCFDVVTPQNVTARISFNSFWHTISTHATSCTILSACMTSIFFLLRCLGLIVCHYSNLTELLSTILFQQTFFHTLSTLFFHTISTHAATLNTILSTFMKSIFIVLLCIGSIAYHVYQPMLLFRIAF